jgi:hypothetical protein
MFTGTVRARRPDRSQVGEIVDQLLNLTMVRMVLRDIG